MLLADVPAVVRVRTPTPIHIVGVGALAAGEVTTVALGGLRGPARKNAYITIVRLAERNLLEIVDNAATAVGEAVPPTPEPAEPAADSEAEEPEAAEGLAEPEPVEPAADSEAEEPEAAEGPAEPDPEEPSLF